MYDKILSFNSLTNEKGKIFRQYFVVEQENNVIVLLYSSIVIAVIRSGKPYLCKTMYNLAYSGKYGTRNKKALYAFLRKYALIEKIDAESIKKYIEKGFITLVDDITKYV